MNNFFYSIRRECRKILRCQPFYGWIFTMILIILGVMVIITIAPLIIQLMVFMLVLLAVIAVVYWLATKTGFIDE